MSKHHCDLAEELWPTISRLKDIIEAENQMLTEMIRINEAGIAANNRLLEALTHRENEERRIEQMFSKPPPAAKDPEPKKPAAPRKQPEPAPPERPEAQHVLPSKRQRGELTAALTPLVKKALEDADRPLLTAEIYEAIKLDAPNDINAGKLSVWLNSQDYRGHPHKQWLRIDKTDHARKFVYSLLPPPKPEAQEETHEE